MGFKSVEATEKEISWLSAKLATLFHCVWGSLAEVSLLISRVGLPSYTWGNQVIPGDTRCHLVDGLASRGLPTCPMSYADTSGSMAHKTTDGLVIL